MKIIGEKNLNAAGHGIRLTTFEGLRIDEEKVPLVLCFAHSLESDEIRDACLEMSCPSFVLAEIEVLDWNAELSPWPAPPLSEKGGEAFGGLGDAYFLLLTNEILPTVFREMDRDPLLIISAGYSLAGMYAVYVLYKTAIFDGVICASGSLWYPDFAAFVKGQAVPPDLCAAYFSLGTKETKTRHPLMSQADEKIRKIEVLYQADGVTTVYEMNPGNHFADTGRRVAKGIHWMLTEGFLFDYV